MAGSLRRRGGAGGGHIRSESLGQRTPRSISRSASRDAPSRPCSSPMVPPHACSASASNGPRPSGGVPFAMAALCGRPSLFRTLPRPCPRPSNRSPRSFALRGLGSADFMVRGDEALLLEINPRPGATLDIFDSDSDPLLGLHLDAVMEGRLPTGGLALEGGAASAIVFAPKRLTVPKMPWPAWAADRPKAGERIDKNRPICTVLARAKTPIRAKRLVEERICNNSSRLWRRERGGRR